MEEAEVGCFVLFLPLVKNTVTDSARHQREREVVYGFPEGVQVA